MPGSDGDLLPRSTQAGNAEKAGSLKRLGTEGGRCEASQSSRCSASAVGGAGASGVCPVDLRGGTGVRKPEAGATQTEQGRRKEAVDLEMKQGCPFRLKKRLLGAARHGPLASWNSS